MSLLGVHRRLRDGADRTPESGWALLETLVSAAVLVVIALAIASSLDAASKASGNNKARGVASSLAEQDQERMRSMSAATLSNYHPAPRPVPSGSVTYTVTSRADWIRDSAGEVESCTAKSGQPEYLRITSTVTSNVVGTSMKPIVERGIVAPPVSFGAGLGTLTVLVQDHDNKPVPGMSVTVQKSGSPARSDVTNDLGCAVFGYIPIGAYTVTATRQYWVDRDGNASATGSTTVTQGNVSTVPLTYDWAGSINTTLDGAAPTNLKLTVTPAARAARFADVVPGSTSASATGLFPFTEPYSVFAGSCSDANPSSYGGSVPTAMVSPGQPTTLSSVLPLPRIRITLQKNGSAYTNAAVKITSTISGCTETTTIPPNGLLTVPMPYGHYRVCADDLSSTGIAIAPANNTSAAGVNATVNITTATGAC
jgi:Tfp pilus assembly protein PilV